MNSYEKEAYVKALAWLEGIEPIAEITSQEDVDAIKSLVGHEGFRLLCGLLLGSRAGLYVQLSHAPLGTSTDAARLSVTQGKIQGIELVRETVLEMYSEKGTTDV